MTDVVDAELVDADAAVRCSLCPRTSADSGMVGKQCNGGTPPCRGRMIPIPSAVKARVPEPRPGELVLPVSVQRKLDRAMEAYDQRAATMAELPDPDARRDPRAFKYHHAARAESTRQRYRFWITEYLRFCADTKRRERPAHASTIEAWTAHLCEIPMTKGKNAGKIGYAPNSIKQSLSAIATYHELMGDSMPARKLAAGVVEGHERTRSEDPEIHDDEGVPGLRLPSLRRMFEVCPANTNAGARDRAVLAMGWAIMARRSELANLDIADVKLVEDGVEVLIRRSKTDQLGKGKKAPINWRPDLGELCPVVCITRWAEILEQNGITSGGFFRGIDRHDRINGASKKDGPGWAGKESVHMEDKAVELIIMRAAIRAGVPDAALLRGHSLRRGGATDFYEGGADILSIARQGRWGERSPVIFKYIEDVDRWRSNPLAVADFDNTKPKKAQRRDR